LGFCDTCNKEVVSGPVAATVADTLARHKQKAHPNAASVAPVAPKNVHSLFASKKKAPVAAEVASGLKARRLFEKRPEKIAPIVPEKKAVIVAPATSRPGKANGLFAKRKPA
jgi:hypothetical protein